MTRNSADRSTGMRITPPRTSFTKGLGRCAFACGGAPGPAGVSVDAAGPGVHVKDVGGSKRIGFSYTASSLGTVVSRSRG